MEDFLNRSRGKGQLLCIEFMQVRKRKAVVARDGYWTVSASEVKRAKRLAQYEAREFSTFNDEEEERREKEKEKQEVMILR